MFHPVHLYHRVIGLRDEHDDIDPPLTVFLSEESEKQMDTLCPR